MQFKLLALALFAAAGVNAAALEERDLVCAAGSRAFCCEQDVLLGIVESSCRKAGRPTTLAQFNKKCAKTGTTRKPACCLRGAKGIAIDCAAPAALPTLPVTLPVPTPTLPAV